MAPQESEPHAHGLQEDELEIIRQMVDVYGCSKEEAEEMWRDFIRLKKKADRPKKRDKRARKR